MEPVVTSALPSWDKSLHDVETGSPIVDRFSLVQGGPIYRFQVAIRMAMPDRSGVAKRALLSILITWLPLLLLSSFQGRAFGSLVRVPFLHDISVNVRFLLGLPLLVVAEVVIDPRLNHCVKHFLKSGLVNAAQLPAFEEAISKTMNLRDALVPTVLILVAAFAPSLWYRKTEMIAKGITSWHGIASPSGEVLSLAGWWFGVISLPLYRVLLFRWLWVIILWAVFLRKVSKLSLGCVPTHPDTAAGLDFLTHAHLMFGFIGFATSAVIAGAFGNSIAYEGATISSLKFLMIAFCLLGIIVIAAPLLLLTPKLAKVKERGIFDYGALGTAYSQSFAAKWIGASNCPERDSLLGTADIQSLADLCNSFSIVRQMKIVLIDKKVLIGLAIPVILPMIPLLVLATPTDQLVRAVLKLLV
jgi:hypothetical protein